MAKDLPEDMEELVYFSRRRFSPEKGTAIAWVKRIPCASCKKGLMSKPKDEKTGKYKVRAKEYVCPDCGVTEDKKEHETKLTCEIVYTCPFCDHEGEADAQYVKKSWYGKKAVVFKCDECSEKLGITKKLSTPEKFLEKLTTSR